MKKELLGIALILFGILLVLLEAVEALWIPIIDDIPFDIMGLISGIWGVCIIAFHAGKSD